MSHFQSDVPWPAATNPISLPPRPFPRPNGLQGAVFISVGVLTVIVVLGIIFPESQLANFLAKCPARRYVKRRYRAWWYLRNGISIIQEGYERSNGQPYEVLAPDARYVFVSSRKHIDEITTAPDTQLSLYFASQQLLQPRYTMHHFGWYDRPLEGTGFQRALRVLLTNSLPGSVTRMRKMVKERFERAGEGYAAVNGGKHIPLARTIIKIIVLANVHALFGEELAQNETFVEKTLEYVEQLIICAEIIRAAPTFLAPIIGRLLGWRLSAQKYVFETLMPVVQQRFVERELAAQGKPVPRHNDCIQYILDCATSKVQRTPAGVAHELMAIWFASVHPTSITIVYAIQNLCLHPEYLTPIRHEVATQSAAFYRTAQGLPLLDSFIRESARLHPMESQTIRRRAIAPFTLSSGMHLRVGDWACAPVTAIMQDAAHYPSPEEFSGFRFAPADVVATLGDDRHNHAPRHADPKGIRLVDGEAPFYMWGAGRQICPGRFYVAALAKVVISYLVEEYDFRLTDPTAPRWFTWRSSRIPREDNMVVFMPRK